MKIIGICLVLIGIWVVSTSMSVEILFSRDGRNRWSVGMEYCYRRRNGFYIYEVKIKFIQVMTITFVRKQ